MEKFKDWLTKRNLPKEVTEPLLQGNFPFGKELGSVRFDSPEDIMEWNEFDLWPNMAENKLLVIGSAINGDPWVINYRPSPLSVAILPHDNMPSKEEKVITDSMVKKVADSIEEFIKLAREDKLPLDYYEIKEK